MLPVSDRELFGRANILVVGAGGIGCELLKNLALLGVNSMTVIDLDTIDVSNLNRQFLFRRHHVDLAKAEVAAEAARRINPSLRIVHHLQRVQSPTFNPEFVSIFDCVLSALDNIEARKHLNRLCLAAQTPLVEAGSAGYIGQCQVIHKGVSECYECKRKEKPKQFPVCTIRSTPTTPVHCVHWARMLYDVLFGPEDAASMLADLRVQLTLSAASLVSAADAFRFLFDTEVAKQAAIEDLWKDGRMRPVSVAFDAAQATSPECAAAAGDSQSVQSVETLTHAFVAAIDRIRDERRDLLGSLTFSKDDPLAVDFVSAAANLRMTNYHIGRISRFQVESIAGSIIPAVATTNAIVAGLQCLNLKKILRAKLLGVSATDTQRLTAPVRDVRDVWVQFPRPTASGYILQPSVPSAPRADCFACSNNYRVARLPDFALFSIAQLVRETIPEVFGSAQFTVFNNSQIVYDPFDEEDEDQEGEGSSFRKYEQSLAEWGIEPGTTLQLESDELSAQLTLLLQDDEETVPGDGDRARTGPRSPRLAKKPKVSD